MAADRITIIGAGRMGQALGLALATAGHDVTLIGRRPPSTPVELPLHLGPWHPVTRGSDIVMLAVPDDAIPEVAGRLSSEGGIEAGHVVLHVSGMLDRSALAPLEGTGAALGSFHPLQTVARPRTAAEGAFAGAAAGIEGDDRASAAGERLARSLGMKPMLLAPGAKPAYHAAAVLVANYTVALTAMAERIVQEAGLEDVRGMFQRLLEGTAGNLAHLAPGDALTGPIRRGDAHTVAENLAALSGNDQAVYRALGLVTLELAKGQGLDPALAEGVRAVLSPGPETS